MKTNKIKQLQELIKQIVKEEESDFTNYSGETKLTKLLKDFYFELNRALVEE